VQVCVLRFANGLGGGLNTAHTRLFRLPAIPVILGFDPRYQFIHEDDIVGVLEHAIRNDLEGIYNGAADGVLALSEIVSLLGKLPLPILPPWGTGIAADALRAAGITIPPEMLEQLRYGRGLDNRRLKASGYRFRYTTREAVRKFREALRIEPLIRTGREPYRYEREVEEFLRYSPSVRSGTQRARLENVRPGERELPAESPR
jgi:UDP-glucose 4-epimerase